MVRITIDASNVCARSVRTGGMEAVQWLLLCLDRGTGYVRDVGTVAGCGYTLCRLI